MVSVTVQEGDSTGDNPFKVERVLEALQAEFGKPFLWTPLAMILGIWLYFSLLQEPNRVLLTAAILGAVLCAWLSRRFGFLILAFAFLSGFALAKLRTDFVATPLLRLAIFEITVTGEIQSLQQRGKSIVVILRVEEIANVPASEKPLRIRFTGSAKLKNNLHQGATISLKANLRPLPRPVAPHAFDYGRQLYFESIGATGQIRSVISTSATQQSDWRNWLAALRAGIGERISAVIPMPLAAFADAIITGERAEIPREINQSLQSSGLAHILSISGLHMTLVAGGVFFAVRAFLALFPPLALRYPIKKIAAVAALLMGLAYLLLADSGSATTRSYIMTAIVFVAVLVDRPAISLNNLVWAALLVLVMSPELALSASFQMSFMAVLGLAAFYGWWSRNQTDPERKQLSRLQVYTRRAARMVFLSVVTSVIAGALSTIPAAYHFGRLAPYGVIANGLALPIVSVIVMPFALLATLLMPLGLEAPPLYVLEQGLKVVMQISDWVATWPGSGALLPLLNLSAAATASIAVYVLCIAKMQLRWLVIPLALLAIYFQTNTTRPDLFIDERAANVAIRNSLGELVPALPRVAAFSVERWLQNEGDTAKLSAAAKREGWTCDTQKCLAQRGQSKIAFLLSAAETAKPCPAVDILIAQYPLRRSCKGKLATIDRFDVWRNGAYAIKIFDGVVEVQNITTSRGKRPWAYEVRARNKLP